MPAEKNAPAVMEKSDQQTIDESAIRALYQRLMDGWNAGSAEAFADVFTEDGDLVGFDGMHFKGRKEIAAFHQPLFDKWLKGTRLVGEVKDIRFLGPDAAVLHAVGGTIMPGKTVPAPERDSIQTLVAAKSGDEWHFVAFQNTRVRPMGRNFGTTLIWLCTDWLWRLFGPKSQLRYRTQAETS